jgi:hypothetical protein
MSGTTKSIRNVMLEHTDALASDICPRDAPVLRALTLLTQASTLTDGSTGHQDWSFFDVAIRRATAVLLISPSATAISSNDLCASEPDSEELRQAAISLVNRLADLFATAAAEAAGFGVQDDSWSRVAQYLQDAAAELA